MPDMSDALDHLNGALAALELAVTQRLLSRARVGRRKTMFICEACGGVYQPVTAGLRCATCGRLIAIAWPGGRAISAEALRQLAALAWGDEDAA